MIIKRRIVREYLTPNGRSPFRDWLDSLPPETLARIQARIFRAEQGNLGDFKAVGHGVCKFRLNFGPGYRIYSGFEGEEEIVLLGGGDKGSQRRDAIMARQCWLEYLARRSL